MFSVNSSIWLSVWFDWQQVVIRKQYYKIVKLTVVAINTTLLMRQCNINVQIGFVRCTVQEGMNIR